MLGLSAYFRTEIRFLSERNVNIKRTCSVLHISHVFFVSEGFVGTGLLTVLVNVSFTERLI